MTLVELSERVGISVVNLSVLKNNHAKAIRFSTLQAIRKALDWSRGASHARPRLGPVIENGPAPSPVGGENAPA